MDSFAFSKKFISNIFKPDKLTPLLNKAFPMANSNAVSVKFSGSVVPDS